MPSEPSRRARPRLWHHDYLHLRPLADDLATRLGREVTARGIGRVLDVGSGGAPYRFLIDGRYDQYVRADLDAGVRPTVIARAEALPFADEAFDIVISTQLLPVVGDPWAMGREMVRVVRPGGTVWLSGSAAWPYDSLRPEHRFGEPELPALLPGLRIREIVREGGMLALPFVILNTVVREVLTATRRRWGGAAAPLAPLVGGIYIVSNAAGRLIELGATTGPLAVFLGYLDARLPMNWLVIAEKAP